MDNFNSSLGGQNLNDVILFRVGGTLYALSIGHVSEIFNETQFTPLPRQPAFCHGAIDLRGATTYIIDLGVLLFPGTKRQDPSTQHRPIIILNKDLNWDEGAAHNQDVRFGLMIDEVQDVMSLGDATVSSPPAGQSAHQLLAKVVNHNEQLIGVIDPFRLRHEVIERWNHAVPGAQTQRASTATDAGQPAGQPKPSPTAKPVDLNNLTEAAVEQAASAVHSINERIVPILTRHIETVRTEAEVAAVEIGRLLTQVTECFETVDALTAGKDASNDPTALQHIRKLNLEAKSAVHSTAVHLQFADKLSQILGRVGHNLSDLGQMIARGEIGENELENWLNSMYQSYTTTAEKENHLGRPVVDEKVSDVTFF